MKYTEPIALRISKEQHEGLKAIAEKSETSVSAIIRQAIRQILETK